MWPAVQVQPQTARARAHRLCRVVDAVAARGQVKHVVVLQHNHPGRAPRTHAHTHIQIRDAAARDPQLPSTPQPAVPPPSSFLPSSTTPRQRHLHPATDPKAATHFLVCSTTALASDATQHSIGDSRQCCSPRSLRRLKLVRRPPTMPSCRHTGRSANQPCALGPVGRPPGAASRGRGAPLPPLLLLRRRSRECPAAPPPTACHTLMPRMSGEPRLHATSSPG